MTIGIRNFYLRSLVSTAHSVILILNSDDIDVFQLFYCKHAEITQWSSINANKGERTDEVAIRS